jgi:hypothetical protein
MCADDAAESGVFCDAGDFVGFTLFLEREIGRLHGKTFDGDKSYPVDRR